MAGKNETEGNINVREWFKTLAPYIVLLLGAWFWMGGAEAKQTVSTTQLSKIEVKLDEMDKKLQTMSETLVSQSKDIEYLKKGSSSLRRFDRSEFSSEQNQ